MKRGCGSPTKQSGLLTTDRNMRLLTSERTVLTLCVHQSIVLPPCAMVELKFVIIVFYVCAFFLSLKSDNALSTEGKSLSIPKKGSHFDFFSLCFIPNNTPYLYNNPYARTYVKVSGISLILFPTKHYFQHISFIKGNLYSLLKYRGIFCQV